MSFQSDDRDAEYFYWLGKFIFSFAGVESGLNAQISLLTFQGLAESKNASTLPKALIGVQTMEAAKTTLKRVLRALSYPESVIEGLQPLFAHLGHIQIMRNCIVHLGAWGEGPYKRVHDAIRSSDTGDTLYISVQTLKDMVDDLDRIPQRISWVINPSLKQSLPLALADHIKHVMGPWRFNPTIPRVPPEDIHDFWAELFPPPKID
jgi:hypothetical protein